MKTHTRSVLILVFALVVYLKVSHKIESRLLAVFTDVTLVVILLGFGEIIILNAVWLPIRGIVKVIKYLKPN